MTDNNFTGRALLTIGLILGIVPLYTGMVGMVALFDTRSIVSGWVTMGQILIFGPALFAGYLIMRRALAAGETGRGLVYGLIAGALTALPSVALLLLDTAITLRPIFVNISPQLTNIFTFGQPLLTGILILTGALAAAGLLGALIAMLPLLIRRSLVTALLWVLLIGALSERAVVPIVSSLFDRATALSLFNGNALVPVVALVLFSLVFLLSLLWAWQRDNVQTRYRSLPSQQRTWTQRIGVLLLLALLLVLPAIVGRFLNDVLVTIGLYVIMGLGLNIAVGQAGLLDLGYLTNYAVGAYVAGVLLSTGALGAQRYDILGLFAIPNFWLVIPIAVLAAMLTGFVFSLPVLRMRGDYLAIATLGFGEIIGRLAISDWLRPYIGGAQGVLGIPKPELFGTTLVNPGQLYYVTLAGALIVLFISIRLNNSRTGRQWMALREDEDAASAMGIDTTRTKVLAFTLSAAAGGLAGAIFAVKVGTVFPNSFTVLVSVNVLSIVIVGGLGSIPGVVVGAIALIGLPEMLREFAEYRLLLYGALLIAMMLLRPEGLVPSEVRRREMEEADMESVQVAGH